MSDIDYDELDQAVSDALAPPEEDYNADLDPAPPEDFTPVEDQDSAGLNSASSEQEEDSTPEDEAPSPDEEPLAPPRRPFKSRGRYLDMVHPKSDMRPPRSTSASEEEEEEESSQKDPAPAPTKVEHETEFGVIEDSYPEDSEAEEEFVSDPTPFSTPTDHQEIEDYEDEAPNPDNYALGGRSPFLEDAIVEKRPLGDHVPGDSNRTVKSTKNVYSSRSPVNPTHTTVEDSPKTPTEILPPLHKKSGVGRFFLILLILLLGAAAGAAAWFIISSGV